MSECLHCDAGDVPVQRMDTKEFVHSILAKGRFLHCICLNKMKAKKK